MCVCPHPLARACVHVRAYVYVRVLVGMCVCVCECAILIDDPYRVIIDSVISVFRKPSVLSDSLVCLVV